MPSGSRVGPADSGRRAGPSPVGRFGKGCPDHPDRVMPLAAIRRILLMRWSSASPMPRATSHAATDKTSLSALFSAAFRQSKNPMVLVDEERTHVDVNGAYLNLLGYRRDELLGRPVYSLIVGGPRASKAEWHAAISQARFTGDTELRGADGNAVAVQYAATTEIVTGRYLVLFVILSTSRWGSRFRRTIPSGAESVPLSAREREVVRLVALGHTGREIADELHVAHDTVRTHVRNATRKLHARSRAHLVAKALAEGLVLGSDDPGAFAPPGGLATDSAR